MLLLWLGNESENKTKMKRETKKTKKTGGADKKTAKI